MLRELFIDMEQLQQKMQTDKEYNNYINDLVLKAYEFCKINPLHLEMHDLLKAMGATDTESLWVYGTVTGMNAGDGVMAILSDAIGIPALTIKRAIATHAREKSC